jgi:hypothetical protein
MGVRADRFQGFSRRDWLLLLLCVAGAWGGSFTLFSLVVPSLLQPTTTQAISLSLTRQAHQLEGKPAGRAYNRALRIWAAAEPPPLPPLAHPVLRAQGRIFLCSLIPLLV